jgi:alkyl sulfatase BDS1-like metallo-beta-lactamase superfamily hydrolase
MPRPRPRGSIDAAALYDLADRQDFGDAARGLIAPWPGPVVSSTDGHVIFDPAWFGFIGDDARRRIR